MSHSISPAHLLTTHLAFLQDLSMTSGVLDLACGYGRNGLFLARHQIPVTFADINGDALAAVQAQLQAERLSGQCWQVDLEQPGRAVLEQKRFDAIIVFNYLHRALFPQLKAAIRPGGLIFYETFTISQRKFGRPSNPDFLLQPGELALCFNDWEVLHNYVGERQEPERAIAGIIARRPMQEREESSASN